MNKLKKLQALYGKEKHVSLDKTIKHLEKIGFKYLANILGGK